METFGLEPRREAAINLDKNLGLKKEKHITTSWVRMRLLHAILNFK